MVGADMRAIPITEALPPTTCDEVGDRESAYVLVWNRGVWEIGCWTLYDGETEGRWLMANERSEGDRVTHWMPLPEPPPRLWLCNKCGHEFAEEDAASEEVSPECEEVVIACPKCHANILDDFDSLTAPDER